MKNNLVGTIIIIAIVLGVSGLTLFFVSNSTRQVDCPSKIAMTAELSDLKARCFSLGNTDGLGVLSYFKGSKLAEIKVTWGTSLNNAMDFVLDSAKDAKWSTEDLKCATDLVMNIAPEANLWRICGSVAANRTVDNGVLWLHFLQVVP